MDNNPSAAFDLFEHGGGCACRIGMSAILWDQYPAKDARVGVRTPTLAKATQNRQ